MLSGDYVFIGSSNYCLKHGLSFNSMFSSECVYVTIADVQLVCACVCLACLATETEDFGETKLCCYFSAAMM